MEQEMSINFVLNLYFFQHKVARRPKLGVAQLKEPQYKSW